MTAADVVIEEAQKMGVSLNAEQAEYVLWEHTGFPEFWAIPTDGATPEECLRKQVREWTSHRAAAKKDIR